MQRIESILRTGQLERLGRQLVAAVLGCSLVAAPVGAQFRQSNLVTVPVLPRTRVEGGVKVLEHDKTAFARATQLVLTGAPVTVAGGADADPAFDLTGAYIVVLLSDGRLVTFTPVGTRMMLFRSNGQGERIIGRQGKGPGEFANVSSMISLPGDTLFLADYGNKRLNWMLVDRGVVRDEPRGTEGRSAFEKAVGMLPGGRIVLTSTGLLQEASPTGVTRPVAPVKVRSSDGKVKEIVAVPDLELVMLETRYRGRKNMHTHMLRFSRVANVIVWDTTVVTTSGIGYTIDIRNAEGKQLSRIVVPVARRAVTKTMRDLSVEREIQRLRGPHSEGLVDAKESERLIREEPSADTLPPYAQMFVSPDKTLWVVDYSAPGDTSWGATAFRSDGAIVGRLNVSGAGRPLAFGNDRVVVRTEDADGVVTLSVRRMAAQPAGAPRR